jgi:hypothetical protein
LVSGHAVLILRPLIFGRKYTKSSIAKIDNMVKRILEDEEHKKLLDILEL